MKTIFIYITIINLLSFSSLAQKTKTTEIDKIDPTQKKPDTLIDEKSTSMVTIKSYRVEENVNQKFGGHTVIYEVSDLKLINKDDLGPNNTRVITPRYKETSQLTENKIETPQIKPIVIIPTPAIEETPKPSQIETPIAINRVIDNSNESDKHIYVYLIKTYERVAEKGYKSVEIFQKLGNAYFFEGEYSKAARWYGELFALTTNIESEYYDRYSYSLKSIGKKEQADEIIKQRNQLFGTE